MFTRSSHGESSSHYESQSTSHKSLPVISTRSRKRKSTVMVEDEEMQSRVSDVSSSHSQPHRLRRSVSSGELREIQFSNIYTSSAESVVERKVASRGRSRVSRTSTPSDVTATSAKSYRRKLVEHDYETRSSTSSSSLLTSSSGNTSSNSFSTRRSSQSDEESVVSTFSSSAAESGLGLDGVTPQSEYGLRSAKDEPQDCSTRACSLPSVCFANCEDIWELMCKMDLKYERNPDLFKHHPNLSPQMRAVLLDWIKDVCESYKMNRETLYLAIDYLDRYLAVQKDVPKTHLQLIGITCLFVAAKLEEIYPPKLKIFAYVTDGVCCEEDILYMELLLMKTLKWKLTPITPATWVSIYLQILAYRNGAIICTRPGADFIRSSVRDTRSNKPSDARLFKHLYDRAEYVEVIRLVDLAILDSQSLSFTYSMLSAAAIYHIKGPSSALTASGFLWEQLAVCVTWMAPAATILRRHEIPPALPSIKDVSDESRHLVQSHCVSLDMLSDAQVLSHQ